MINAAARQLGEQPDSLRNEIVGSTVNAQNLVQVTATADQADRGGAPRGRGHHGAARLRRPHQRPAEPDVLQQRLRGPRAGREGDRELQAQLKTARTLIQRQNLNLILGSLLAQRQGVLSSLAENAAAGRPTLQGISQETSANKVRPRPGLYALVGGIVAALISARVAQLLLRRRRPDDIAPLAAA